MYLDLPFRVPNDFKGVSMNHPLGFICHPERKVLVGCQIVFFLWLVFKREKSTNSLRRGSMSNPRILGRVDVESLGTVGFVVGKRCCVFCVILWPWNLRD